MSAKDSKYHDRLIGAGFDCYGSYVYERTCGDKSATIRVYSETQSRVSVEVSMSISGRAGGGGEVKCSSWKAIAAVVAVVNDWLSGIYPAGLHCPVLINNYGGQPEYPCWIGAIDAGSVGGVFTTTQANDSIEYYRNTYQNAYALASCATQVSGLELGYSF